MTDVIVDGPFADDKNDQYVSVIEPVSGDEIARFTLCPELSTKSEKAPSAPKPPRRAGRKQVQQEPDDFWKRVPADETLDGKDRVYFHWVNDPGFAPDSAEAPVVYYGCNAHYWGFAKKLMMEHGAVGCVHEIAKHSWGSLIAQAQVKPADNEWMRLCRA